LNGEPYGLDQAGYNLAVYGSANLESSIEIDNVDKARALCLVLERGC